MNTLRDIKRAEHLIKQTLRHPSEFRAESYRGRERIFYKGVDNFINGTSDRSKLMGSAYKAFLASGAVLLAAAGLDVIPKEILSSPELVNSAFVALGLAGGAVASKHKQDLQLKQAVEIKSSVDEYRDDRFNYGLNNISKAKN